ncbi:hypothetical protein [Azospirillum sp. SYSU D00513]|uniref:hypothetical protein n=1 Tax=Azospirillum sp. SYSU D00513 TaxID=2812561 RepID=UPI001A97C457|nr:hypothetical protein [Azospirillum sp. SYSU D00513]
MRRALAGLQRVVGHRLVVLVASVLLGSLSASPGLTQTASPGSTQTPAPNNHGGTAPHAVHRAGDAASFLVLGPGANSTGNPVILTMANRAEGYRLVTNNPLPSSWVGDYTLSVSTVTASGASASRSFTITYEPGSVGLVTAPSGEILIPAVQHSFLTSTGQYPITTQAWKLPDGSILSGPQEVRVSSHKDSKVAVTVGGVRVNPGDVGVPVGQYDFTLSQGVLALPMAAADAGIEGEARLLVTTPAPRSPALDFRVKTWAPHVALTSPSWTVRQAFDEARVELTPQAGNRCELTLNYRTARDTNMLTAPKCLVEWEPKPEDLKVAPGTNPTLQGRMWTNGTYTVGYKISLIDIKDVKVPFSSGTATLTVAPINNLLSYKPLRESDEVYRMIQPVEVMMQQSGGPTCDVYTLSNGGEYRSSNAVVRCALTWTALPDNLTQDVFWSRPRLTGTINEPGTQTVGYKVEVVTPVGARIPAGVGTFDYQVFEPPVPSIREEVDEEVSPGLYPVSREGGYVGDIIVTAANATTKVVVQRASATVDENEYEPYPWGKDRDLRRRINATESDLWSQTPWTVFASYTDMPWVKADRTFHTLAVPSENIKPVITLTEPKLLDTEDVPLRVSIRDIYKAELGYDAAKMGEWRVRVVRYGAGNTLEPLTDFADLDAEGNADFILPSGMLPVGSVRVTAEAVVVSPVPGYSRTELATRPLNIVVLKGGAIEAGLIARRIMGEAPLASLFTAALGNRMDMTALGEVVWEVSADNGATWTPRPSQRNNKLRMSAVFAKGEYLVKATLKNKHSGAQFMTETVQVIAFNVPKGTMTGPEHIFIGGTGRYKLDLTFQGTPLTEDDVAVEWSVDGGKTYSAGHLQYDLTRSETARIVLVGRARMADAPAEAPDAWREIRRRVNFMVVRPARVRVVGPSRVEYPKSADFRGVMGLPYRNMDVELRGWWTLPDGTRVDGPMLTYTPKQDEIAAEIATLTFHAEIVDVEGTHNETDKRVRVWEYVWPEFRIDTQRTSQYAPGDMTLRLRQMGTTMELDKPTYSWAIPPTATILDQANQTVRVVRTTTAGECPVSVSVSDARGNTALATTTANMLPAPNYALSLTVTPSNPYSRAPLDIVVRPNISGGHPRDRVLSLTYLLNGQPMESASNFGRTRLPEGRHTIEVQARTEMGWTFGASQDVTVLANQIPTCGVTMRESSTGWHYYANCTDADGRVLQYRWTLDGVPENLNSNRITVSRYSRDSAPLVTLTAVDDAGAESVPVSPVVEVPTDPPEEPEPAPEPEPTPEPTADPTPEPEEEGGAPAP